MVTTAFVGAAANVLVLLTILAVASIWLGRIVGRRLSGYDNDPRGHYDRPGRQLRRRRHGVALRILAQVLWYAIAFRYYNDVTLHPPVS